MTKTYAMPFAMVGHLTALNGDVVARGGFLPAQIPGGGFAPGLAEAPASLQRGSAARLLTSERKQAIEAVQRGDFSGDLSKLFTQLGQDVQQLQRGITTGNAGFPVRQNLEAPAALLVPTETPLRNLLPRVPGAGAATTWRQLTSLGGGWGNSYDQPGGGSVIRMFYPETGAPVEHTSTYAAKTASYKLLGTLGSVTGFAQATGLTYQDQLGRERQNQLTNLMLNEELALLRGDSTSTAAPWGDGTNALAFDGLLTLCSTANGTPASQVQTAVGPLTTAHIDAQLTRIVNAGGRGLWVMMNARETSGMTTLLQKSGAMQRIVVTNDAGNATMGFRVAKYIHSVSGQEVDIYTSLFMLPGEMLFGARTLYDGSPVAEVEVLPQVPIETAPEKPQQIQGYVVTDLARSLTQPDTAPFLISCYETLKLRSALHLAKSTGIEPPAA